MEFKAFLSHRYKSPEANQYFFDIFSRVSEVQFEVDAGSTPTCVTRLERMVRDCDAFIGIYPLPIHDACDLDKDFLLADSKYFRLECNIAIRSRVPVLVFYDERYRNSFAFPNHVTAEQVDMREVASPGGFPNRRRHEWVFDGFKEEVRTYREFNAASDQRHSRTSVGLIVPQGRKAREAYTPKQISLLEKILDEKGYTDVIQFDWPPVFDGALLSALENTDFVVVDVGNEAMATGIVGFLQGRFIPCVRLLKNSRPGNSVFTRRPNQENIFGAIPVGYRKDIVYWNTTAELRSGFANRLALIRAQPKRINTKDEAAAYFDLARLRNDPVFLSYSGKDAEFARPLSAELKKRFQCVFDYKDGQSITPGQPWISEIFDSLSGSKLAVPLISKNYLESGNCIHEAEEMVALRDVRKLKMIPLKLRDEDIDTPSWMRNRQYMHHYDYPNDVAIVNKLIEFFD